MVVCCVLYNLAMSVERRGGLNECCMVPQVLYDLAKEQLESFLPLKDTLSQDDPPSSKVPISHSNRGAVLSDARRRKSSWLTPWLTHSVLCFEML